MAWLPDEQYVLMQDTREKKITARSARHTRSHCGKSGSVKFPSDYLSKKELKAMSGECQSYRMNDPMTWEEFNKLPDDLKVCYVKALRQKYNVPDRALCEMFGTTNFTVSTAFEKLGLRLGKNGRAKRTWDKDGFYAWMNGVKVTEVTGYPTAKEQIKEMEKEAIATIESVADAMKEAGLSAENVGGSIEELAKAIPTNGTLVFEGKADTILRSVNDILGSRYVKMSVQWSVAEAPAEDLSISMDTDAFKKMAATIDYAILNEQRKQTLHTMG